MRDRGSVDPDLHADQIALFRAAMDQARAMGREVSLGAAEFYEVLTTNGVPIEAATVMTVEWIAQLMQPTPILLETDEDEEE